MKLAIEAPPLHTLTIAGRDEKCVAYLSEYEALEPGDIIMTGTPEGVNAVVAGDVMRGAIAGLGEIEVRVEG